MVFASQVEEEIQTLSQVLAAKEKHLAEIKRKLGISSLQELKQNLSKGWQDVTSTNAYVSSLEHSFKSRDSEISL